MEYLWIGLAMFGAALQAIRTAAQRQLNEHVSALGATYARSLFGLPILLAWLWLVQAQGGGTGWPVTSWVYLAYTFAGALAQVLATLLLVLMFRLKNFAVGTMLTKVDVVITAIIGWLFFSEVLGIGGVVALAVVLVGMALMSFARLGPHALGGDETALELLTSRASLVAFGCAFSFSLSYLFFREAALNIDGGSVAWRAAWTVAIATAMQTVLVGLWLWRSEPGLLRTLLGHARLSWFIGITSAIGSICWFTAFTLENASYVRAVGQVEVIFTLMVSALYFKERILPLEYAGIAATVIGVVMFRLLT